jgi:cobalt-zinc-cadmium resistance protein CzcA
MQRDEKTLDVVKRVEAEVDRINAGGILPSGVKLVPYYDRAELVHVTVGTVLHNLIYGVVLIFLIQWLFLGNLRSAIIVAATIPCALFSAVFVLVMRGDSANLLSVGSLDLGIIVDGSVIMVENIFRRLQRDDHTPVDQAPPPARQNWAPVTGDIWTEKTRQIFRAATEVDKSILFSVAITVAAFIPLFTMQGIEGQIFGPMAKTYAYALLGALIAAFTVTPVLASVLLPARVKEKETFVVRFLDHLYKRLLAQALRHRAMVLVGAAALGLLTAAIVPLLGTEFLPKLEEGNLWIRASLPKTISIESGRKVVSRIRDVLRSYPEIVTVVSQHGRPDDGTDPAGFFNAEFFAPLKPFDQWPSGVTKEKLVAEIQARFEDEFIGVEFNFSQYIQDNVEEATSGVKGENSVKLFGRDLTFLETKGNEIKSQMETVKGIQDLGLFSLLGQPSLLVKINRTESARYGFAPGDVNAVVQTALAGSTATNIYEGERQFPLVARLLPQYRDSIEAIRNIQIANQNGGSPTTYVPLSSVANISLESGASYIYRENNERYIPIKFSVRERDLGSTVAEVQDKVKAKVKLPPGYHIEWSGEFGALQEAKARLAIIVPLSVLLIMLLLYSLFNSVVKSLLALTTIPFAACGGLLALYLTGTNFSISSAIGFVSLFGVSVMDGILMLTYYTQLHQAGMPRLDALQNSAETRMRQVLMTAMSACIGLLPAAMSTGIGSQVQRPLATVVVGGLLLAPILTLFVVPVQGTFILPDEQFLKRQKKKRKAGGAEPRPEGAPAE